MAYDGILLDGREGKARYKWRGEEEAHGEYGVDGWCIHDAGLTVFVGMNQGGVEELIGGVLAGSERIKRFANGSRRTRRRRSLDGDVRRCVRMDKI